MINETLSTHGEKREEESSQESEPTIENVLLIIKPDALDQNLEEEIFEYINSNNLDIVRATDAQLNESDIHEIWPHIYGEKWTSDTVEYMTSSPVIALSLRGEGAIEKISNLKNDLRQKHPNPNPVVSVLHSSDSPDDFVRESSIFFGDNENKQNQKPSS